MIESTTISLARTIIQGPQHATDLKVLYSWYLERFEKTQSAPTLPAEDQMESTLAALFERTRADAPLVNRQDATDILHALDGLQLPMGPITELPRYLAFTVLETKLQAPDLKPMRLAFEEGELTDDQLKETESGRQYARFCKCTPEEALAHIVGAMFWRAHQEYCYQLACNMIAEGKRSEDEPLDPRTDRFFRLAA